MMMGYTCLRYPCLPTSRSIPLTIVSSAATYFGLARKISSVASTRFMIISDTHSYDFENRISAHVPLRHPLPKVDVLLHCGDLTMVGDPVELTQAVKTLGAIDAELKLVIAGNHDLTLDGPFWRNLCRNNAPKATDDGMSDEYDHHPKDHNAALEIMTGELAKAAGVTYLEEGLHTFNLSNGAKFTIYTSPYQPEFCGWAFPYERHEDRFNSPEHVKDGVKSTDGVKVPDFPAVDIMMTHGPPRGILDLVDDGRMMQHVGCDALMTAVSRARPQLYCFGHIHEGHGAQLVSWKTSRDSVGKDAILSQTKQARSFPLPSKPEIAPGFATLMVNAAIMNVQYTPSNAPWIVDLDLPCA